MVATVTAKNQTDELWDAYGTSRTIANRNALVEHYLDMCNKAARGIAKRLPAGVSIDDLEQLGAIGLIDAIERCEGDRHGFKTFAQLRISGTIMDGLRNSAWHTRHTMRKIKAADAASETFQQDHGYQPTPEELTERCGENVAKMAGRHTYPTSLEEPTDAGLTPTFIDDRATRAQQRLADDLTARAIVNDVARNGTMMEAAILRLRYFEGLGIKEVGNRIGYSEAYVHAILSSLLRRLQAKYMPAV